MRRAGERVRVTAQLIDATTGFLLWSESYDLPLKDVFAVQDEITRKIVTTLKLQLTLWKQGWMVRKRTDNLEAYDYYLREMESFWRLTKEASVQARQMWEKTIALDPQYAEAHTWLGWTYYREWSWRWSMDPQTLNHALVLAQKAVSLEDSLPGAHSLLSSVYAQQQQHDQALAEGERAITLEIHAYQPIFLPIWVRSHPSSHNPHDFLSQSSAFRRAFSCALRIPSPQIVRAASGAPPLTKRTRGGDGLWRFERFQKAAEYRRDTQQHKEELSHEENILADTRWPATLQRSELGAACPR
ncbi:MAG TPA: hypothetical protein VNN62_05230 [Methylomirabilota bacterium]|nr:hypothetical protein [Methylomirabilota bacterium]